MATGGSNGVAKLPTQTPAGPHPVRLLDLFAGAGGLSVGFHRSGGDRIRVVGAVEADRAAAATFSANFPDVPVYRGLIEDWLREETVPSAEIVVGGPPCQGFSTLGKRDEDDERNGLWESYADAVSRARPLYFVLENVPQFARSDQFSLLRKQMRRGGLLEDYSFDTQILNAAHYGSAQLRKRVVVIGHRKDVPMPGFPQPTTPGESSWRTVADAWTGLGRVSQETRPPVRSVEFEGSRLAGPYVLSELHLMRRYKDISLRRFAAIPAGGNRTDLPDDLQMECWRKHTSGAMDVMGRLSLGRPSVTIRTEFTKPEKGRYLHPHENRAITIAEGARLQGFPDDYKFVGSLTQITRQIGNAVPVELSSAIANHLLGQIL